MNFVCLCSRIGNSLVWGQVYGCLKIPWSVFLISICLLFCSTKNHNQHRIRNGNRYSYKSRSVVQASKAICCRSRVLAAKSSVAVWTPDEIERDRIFTPDWKCTRYISTGRVTWKLIHLTWRYQTSVTILIYFCWVVII